MTRRTRRNDTWDPLIAERRLNRITARPPCPTAWKRHWPTITAAQQWAAQWRRDNPDEPATFEAYECPCGRWHLRNAYKQQLKRRTP